MSNINSEIQPKEFLAKLNDNQLIKFGGGGLAVFFILSSIVAGIFTSIDPKCLVGAGFFAFVLMLLIWINHVWHSQRTASENIDRLELGSHREIQEKVIQRPAPLPEKVMAVADVNPPEEPIIWELHFDKESTKYVQRLDREEGHGVPERYYIGVYNHTDTLIKGVRVEVDAHGREGVKHLAIRLREKNDQEPFSSEYTIHAHSELFFLIGEVDGRRQFSLRGEDQYAFPPHNVTLEIAVTGENVPKIKGRLPLWWRSDGLDIASGRLAKI